MKQIPSCTDVLIVGAGPTGLALATTHEHGDP
jgi:cation diffusion facilitator CzcD-associated flavoprotein CzcO